MADHESYEREPMGPVDFGAIDDPPEEAWLAAAAASEPLEALAAAGIDAATLREAGLVEPLDAASEARIAERAVAAFFEREEAAALPAPVIPVGPGFLVDDPRAPRLAAAAAAGRGRGWRWRYGPALAAAAVLLVMVIGRSQGPLEERMEPSRVQAVAADGERPTPLWWPRLVAPPAPSRAEGEDAPEEEAATPTRPLRVPGATPGGVVGGVVGGSLGGVAGGVAGGVVEEEAREVEARVESSGGAGPPDVAKGVDPPPRQGAPMRLEAVMARGIYTPDPDPRALAATRTGAVERRPCRNRTSFCVGRDGRTSEVQTQSSCGDARVDELCRDAVKKWRFRPFVDGGQPVSVCTAVTFDLKFDRRP